MSTQSESDDELINNESKTPLSGHQRDIASDHTVHGSVSPKSAPNRSEASVPSPRVPREAFLNLVPHGREKLSGEKRNNNNVVFEKSMI